jgi:hypothetical protein
MIQDLETSTRQKLRDKKLRLHVLKAIRELIGDKNYVVLTILHRRAISPPSCINVPNPSRILMCVNPISWVKNKRLRKGVG